jgi:hypothetical protein
MASTMGKGPLKRQPKPPIFAVDGLDVAVYATTQDAFLHLEPSDVEDGSERIYDAEGRLVLIETDGTKITGGSCADEPSHADELTLALRGFLAMMNEPQADDPTCDLPCLVELSLKYVYTVPSRFWPFGRR